MALYFDVEKFISSVRARPQLWNQQDAMYRNAELKNKLWIEVSKEMGNVARTHELKQKWHNLRDVFRREKKLINSRNTAKKKRWVYYNNMQFLSSQICKNYNSQDKPEDESEGTEVSVIKTEEPEDRKDYLEPLNSHTKNENENLDQEMSNCIPCAEIEPRNHIDFGENDDYHFAMSIIPHMRQVPMHRKLKMRIKISEIIAEELKCNWSTAVDHE